MPEPLSDTTFADLAHRCLDGSAGVAEHARLDEILLNDAERAAEYASLVRFEGLMHMTCRREVKALLEFVAMEAASGAPAAAPSFGERITQWRTAASSWGRVAALFLALAGLVALWFSQDHSSSRPELSPPLAVPVQVRVKPVAEGEKIIMLAPRAQPIRKASTGVPSPTPAEEAPKALTLAERLDDFYLPAVSLHEVSAQDAADWLTTQLREHNHAKRPDLDALTLSMPDAVGNRVVTMESGPISFKNAVEIVSSLAGGEATIVNDRIQIVDLSTPASTKAKQWQSSPWGKEETLSQAAAVGIALDDTTVKTEPNGSVSLQLPENQQRALDTLAGAQKQLEALAPLRFVPLWMPAGTAGTERVLTADETTAMRQQLSATLAGPLPLITLPFSNVAQASPVLQSSGAAVLSLSVTPVGEMNQITIQPATTTQPVTPASPGSDLLAEVSPATLPKPAAVNALLNQDQGLVVTLVSTSEGLFTVDGIPIPPGYEYLYGYATPTDVSGGAAMLMLVPAP